jgi:hypothetical protein
LISTITLNGNTVSVVSVPAKPGLRSVQYSAADAVAIVSSPFTGQTQAQQWPGADMWMWTVTLPPLTAAQADDWVSMLLEMRGMANALQQGDPMHVSPRGAAIGAGVPVVNGGVTVVAGGQTLYTRAWAANKARVLVPGDHLQVGYRLHRVIDPVNTDGSGHAPINIWPSLREVPTDGEPIVLNNPRGLFRLATNKRDWSADMTRLTRLSFPIMEYR